MSEQADLLYEDPKLSNQQFTCVSFVSPEKILKKKEQFLFDKFLNNWDLNKSTSKFGDFLTFLSFKYKLNNNDVMKEFESFMQTEQEKFKSYNCTDDYNNFIDAHEVELEKEFNEANQFQTNVRGIKVRGCFATQEEAELRCKILRELEPSHDVYVGPVGMWMPWHPEAYKTNRVEYLEKELNDLMHEKKKNEDKATTEFNKRVVDAKMNAINENIEKAKETGNKLTQNVNEDGNLVNVNEDDNGKISVKDIEAELFDAEDVRLKDDKETRSKSTL